MCAQGGTVRRPRFGWWTLVLCLAAGRAPATTQAPMANDQADVWFLQHRSPTCARPW
jgi:hypothetical protein